MSDVVLDDVVLVKSRTGKTETFMWDSVGYEITPKKGLHLSRFLAGRALAQNALEWNPGTGEVLNAKIFIDEDKGTPLATPSDDLTKEAIAVFKNTDGLGDDTILIDGKPVKKVVIDFRNKYEEKDFSKNNTA